MITIENSALLIVDVQGKLAEQVHDSSGLINNLSILIQGAKLLSIPIVWVEQLPEKHSRNQRSVLGLITKFVLM